MDVLTLNPGSSSLRFQIVRLEPPCDAPAPARLGGGSIASIGPRATVRARIGSDPARVEPVGARDHIEALDRALEWLQAHGLGLHAVGVRLVHVGGGIGEARVVDAALLDRLRELVELAPLHTGPAVALIERLATRLDPPVPVAAVSDSAFHATLPQVAREYALPREWTRDFAILRYGYHGLAVRSVVARFGASHPEPNRLVVAHLGHGCSVTAVRGGRSVDTSMGFSPLEGLIMGTRSGSVDPAVISLLCRALRTSPDDVVRQLHQRSGLLGVSGASSDMREIEALRARGDPAAELAFGLFAYRARAHLAAAMAALGGAEAVLFSGGIGENSPAVRAAVLAGMEWSGLALDPQRNAEPGSCAGRISQDGSSIAVHVVGADEEEWIARATGALLTVTPALEGRGIPPARGSSPASPR